MPSIRAIGDRVIAFFISFSALHCSHDELEDRLTCRRLFAYACEVVHAYVVCWQIRPYANGGKPYFMAEANTQDARRAMFSAEQ